MIGHILFDVPVGYPLQHQFQQPLPIHFAAHILVAQADTGAVALGEMPEDSYRAALELAKVEFEPVAILQELFSIEATRLRKGIQYENEMNLGLEQDTQNCVNSLVNITKSINDIVDGQKLTVEFENNLSSMIEAMNLDDEERIDAEIIEADFIEKE